MRFGEFEEVGEKYRLALFGRRKVRQRCGPANRWRRDLPDLLREKRVLACRQALPQAAAIVAGAGAVSTD